MQWLIIAILFVIGMMTSGFISVLFIIGAMFLVYRQGTKSQPRMNFSQFRDMM